MYRSVLSRVFKSGKSVLLTAVVSFSVMSLALVMPNLPALKQVFESTAVTSVFKTGFLFSLYGSLFTNFTFWSAIFLVLLAALFGVNVSLLTYYVRCQKSSSNSYSIQLSTWGGFISGLFGVGCAACGSVILTAFLGTIGAGGLLLLLPFHGAEFGIIGLLLLCASIRYLIKKIAEPLVCV